MPFFAAPLLAQAITLGAGDRTELRYVMDRNRQDLQGETRGLLFASYGYKRGAVTLSYSPSLTVAPIESKPRDVIVQQSVHLNGIATFTQARTRWELAEDLDVSQQNFALSAVSAPTPTAVTQTTPNTGTTTPGETGMPPAGAGTTPPAQGGTTTGTGTTQTTPVRAQPLPGITPGVLYLTERTRASMYHQLSRSHTFTTLIAYNVAGGLSAKSRANYPLIHGPEAQLSLIDRFTRRDSLTNTLIGNASFTSRGDRLWFVADSESIEHQFTKRTRGTLGLGLSYNHQLSHTGEETGGLYALGTAVITHTGPVARGTLTERAGVLYAPVLDQVAVAYSQRISIFADASWTRKRFVTTLALSSTISLHPTEAGGLDATSASLTTAYTLGAGFVVEGGARASWQTFQGNETIPPTGVLFAAIVWHGAVTP